MLIVMIVQVTGFVSVMKTDIVLVAMWYHAAVYGKDVFHALVKAVLMYQLVTVIQHTVRMTGLALNIIVTWLQLVRQIFIHVQHNVHLNVLVILNVQLNVLVILSVHVSLSVHVILNFVQEILICVQEEVTELLQNLYVHLQLA